MWPAQFSSAPMPGSAPVHMPPQAMEHHNQSQYTPDQWQAMQQWQQWQQQYMQWQAQYGEQYVAQMQGVSPYGVAPPPLPSETPAAPPPPPGKPPPHQNDQPLYGPPATSQMNYPPPIPVNSYINPYAAVTKPNVQTNIQQNVYTPQTKQWNNTVSSTLPNTYNPIPPPANQPYSNQPRNIPPLPQDNSSQRKEVLVPQKTNDVLSEEELQFDIQFKKWEEEFDKWKQQNANHPDKKAYREYEMKFEACRAQLLERRQQMKSKRLGQTPEVAKPAPPKPVVQISNPPVINKPIINQESNYNSSSMYKNYNYDNSNQAGYPNTNYDNSQVGYGNADYKNSLVDYENADYDDQVGYPNDDYDDAQGSLFPSADASKGIPGLDLADPDQSMQDDMTPQIDQLDKPEKIQSNQQNFGNIQDFTQKPPTFRQSNMAANFNTKPTPPKLMDVNQQLQYNNVNVPQPIQYNNANVQGPQNPPTNSYNENWSNYQPKQNNVSQPPSLMSLNVAPIQIPKKPLLPSNDTAPFNSQNKMQAGIQNMNNQYNAPNANIGPGNFSHRQDNRNIQNQNIHNQNMQNQSMHSQNMQNQNMQNQNIHSQNVQNQNMHTQKIHNIEPSQPVVQDDNYVEESQMTLQEKWACEPTIESEVWITYEHNSLRSSGKDFIEPEQTFAYDHIPKEKQKSDNVWDELDMYATMGGVQVIDYQNKSSNNPYATRDKFDLMIETKKNRPSRFTDIEDFRDERSQKFAGEIGDRRYDDSDDFSRTRRGRDTDRDFNYERNSQYPGENRERRYDDRNDYSRNRRSRDREDFHNERSQQYPDEIGERRFDERNDYSRNRRSRDRSRERHSMDRNRSDRYAIDRNRGDKYSDRYRESDQRYSERNRDSMRRNRSPTNRNRSIDKVSISSKEDVEEVKIVTVEPFGNKTISINDLLELPGREIRPQKMVFIIRGPPGSGKSHVARLIKEREIQNGGTAPKILSIDDYFIHEESIEEKDPKTGAVSRKLILKYVYDESQENTYMNSLKRAFKRTITSGYFDFIIVDAVFDQLRGYADLWNFSKQNGFQAYICQMDLDADTCFSRNIHDRTLEDIQIIVSRWFPTPKHHLLLDCSTLLETAIEDVTMEEADNDVVEISDDNQDEQVEPQSYKSKWEQMEDNDKLARLDGTSKPLRPSHQSMDEYLQLDEWQPTNSKPGKKTVRWADIEERRKQDKMRAIGFVVGQTDWNRMTDPTQGSSALTQTKYIARVKKF